MRELHSKIKVVDIINAISSATTITPATGVDRKGFDAVEICVAVGIQPNAGSSPAETWTFALQDSADNSTFAAVTDTNLVLHGSNQAVDVDASGIFATVGDETDSGSSPVTASDDETVYRVGYLGDKQYLRVVATAANTPGATPIHAWAILGSPHQRPTLDD